MMKKVCKLFMAWQFEEEEQWLNQMSRQGWQLEKTNGLLYTFQQGGMDQYQYRVQMVDSLSKAGDYLQFLSEAGIEHVGTCFNGLWIYLRKQNNGEPFELFSDTTSQLRHLQKIKKQLGSSHCGTLETNLTSIHEVAGSIPGLAQWIKDLVFQ